MRGSREFLQSDGELLEPTGRGGVGLEMGAAKRFPACAGQVETLDIPKLGRLGPQ